MKITKYLSTNDRRFVLQRELVTLLIIEGVNGVNRLATKGENIITHYRQNEKQITD